MSVGRSIIYMEEDEEEEENGDEGVEEQEESDEEQDRRKRVTIRLVCGEGIRAPPSASSTFSSSSSSSSSSATLCCQADECALDLLMAKPYHRRHKVCERHAKATVVLVNGLRQRFCQQCSRFHEISEFDGTKKSCRERLAGHNLRRRKASHLQEKMDRNHQRPE